MDTACMRCNEPVTSSTGFNVETPPGKRMCWRCYFELNPSLESYDRIFGAASSTRHNRCSDCDIELPGTTGRYSDVRHKWYCIKCWEAPMGAFAAPPKPQEESAQKEEADKHDQDKLPFHLIPPEAIIGEAMVLRFGARKYGERNWEKGMAWSRPFRAARGHLLRWWCGIKFDKESKLNHLFHVRTNIDILIAHELRQIGTDDRPKDSAAASLWGACEGDES